MSKQKSSQSERYYVVSRQDYVIAGTKETGYTHYRSAVKARNRIDARDAASGGHSPAMRVILAK